MKAKLLHLNGSVTEIQVYGPVSIVELPEITKDGFYVRRFHATGKCDGARVFKERDRCKIGPDGVDKR